MCVVALHSLVSCKLYQNGFLSMTLARFADIPGLICVE